MTGDIIKIKISTYSNHDKSASEESKWNQQGIEHKKTITVLYIYISERISNYNTIYLKSLCFIEFN